MKLCKTQSRTIGIISGLIMIIAANCGSYHKLADITGAGVAGEFFLKDLSIAKERQQADNGKK